MGIGALIRREERTMTPSSPAQLGWAQYLHLFSDFSFNGVSYMVPSGSISQLTALQSIRNPIILRCIIMRASVFSEVRFAWQNIASGRAARNLFGTQSLSLLEEPWQNGSTGDFLGRAEVDNSMYGNSYWYVSGPQQLTWLDPMRMRILTVPVPGPSGINAGVRLAGYQLVDARQHVVESFMPNEIIHFHPIPDPDNPFRGLSWLSALLQDVTTDQDISNFKSGFLRNSATPNLVVTLPEEISEQALANFKDRVEASHVGPQQSFKTMYVTEGTEVKAVGSSWADMELFATQSYGDTRLCVAAGVPASLVGIAEGLKGSALNAGNYTATRRSFADITMRPLWREVCAAIGHVLPAPGGSRLWYDDRDVAFLQADMADTAAVRTADAASITSLITAGFSRDSVVEAVTTNDFSALEEDPKVISVQLQPTTMAPAAIAAPSDDEAEPDDNEDDDDDK